MKKQFPTAELGQFIVTFQAIESHLTELLIHLVGADDEFVHALISELEYNSRLRATDVIFARYAELNSNSEPGASKSFHKLMVELQSKRPANPS